MILVFIHEVRSGNNDNLIIDTNKKVFKYLKGSYCSANNSQAVLVKTKTDIDRLINSARQDGYAFKLGSI